EAVSVLTEPELAGAVRIGTPDDYASRFLPPILVRFARSHPRVQVEVHCEPSRRLRAALEKEELDLALVTCPPGEENGEILRREPVVWATSERHQVHTQEPLPLAVFHSGCIFRAWAIRALDAAGRSYRIAYSSPSIAGIQAAVLSGLAVTALGQSTLAPGMRALGVEEGFPTLPASTIALLRAPGRRSRVIDSLARQVADCFRSLESEAA
nr:LysR substrate-binding domain-containing protein [Pseudomonadota bacterium]